MTTQHQNGKYQLWLKQVQSIEDQEARSAFVWRTCRSKKNLDLFGKFFFPHIIQGSEEVPECHIDLILEIAKPKDSAIIFPRGFAKSTWIKIDILHDIVYGLEPLILYVGNTLTDAQFHIESIRVELENNGRLAFVYGDLVPQENDESRKWTNKHFETANGINVVARGAGKGRGVNIKNQRPTKIVVDDGEDDQMVRKAERRMKFQNWLMQVIFPSRDKTRGKIKIIGTVLHEKCIVLEFYKQHGGIFRRAIENGRSIWPARWTLQELNKEKQKIGTRAFMQEYQNQPSNEELAMLNPRFIDEHTYTALPRFTHKRKVIYMDPQAGESAESDEYAITVLVFEKNTVHRYVESQVSGRASQLMQAYLLVRTWINNKDAFIVGVEKVLNQTAVFQNIMEWKRGKLTFLKLEGFDKIDESDRNIPLFAHSPSKSGSTRGFDKVGRAQMQEASFERGEIHLHASMQKLRDQLVFLGTELIDHDDCADCLIGALELSHRSSFVSTKETVYTREQQKLKTTIAGNLYKEKF